MLGTSNQSDPEMAIDNIPVHWGYIDPGSPGG